jgi:hypothetical protein
MALDFIGPAVKELLTRRGYVITRPTTIERTQLRSFWEEWFSREPALFGDVYAQNREILKRVSKWISEEALEASLWRYGVPQCWIDGPVSGFLDRTGLTKTESEITSADLLGFIARTYENHLSYLEIGVSVGKNILQIASQTIGAKIVGLDVEEINPLIPRYFDTCEVIWRDDQGYLVNTLNRGMVRKTPSITRLTHQLSGNVLDYLSADQFRDDTWMRLSPRKFNLIFSDGVHTPGALRSELAFLLKHDLIDRSRFVMLWDDLVDIGMQTAFMDNAKQLCALFGRGDEAISLYLMHGSYGFQRYMGVFSSFTLLEIPQGRAPTPPLSLIRPDR